MGNRLLQDARKFVEVAKNSGSEEAHLKAKNALSSAYANTTISRKTNTPRSTKRARILFIDSLYKEADLPKSASLLLNTTKYSFISSKKLSPYSFTAKH